MRTKMHNFSKKIAILFCDVYSLSASFTVRSSEGQSSEDEGNPVVVTGISSSEQGAQEDAIKNTESEQVPVVEHSLDGRAEKSISDNFDLSEEEKNAPETARKFKKLKKLRKNAEEENLSNQEMSGERERAELGDGTNDPKTDQRVSNNKPDREQLPTQMTVPEMPDVSSLMLDVFGGSDDDSILRDSRPWSELDDLDDTSILEAKKDLQKFISYKRKLLRQATRVSVKAKSSGDGDALDSHSDEEENSDYVGNKVIRNKRSGHHKERSFVDDQNAASYHRKKKYTEDEIRQKINHVINMMIDACEADRQSNIQRKPATQKLQHLNQFKEMLLHVGWQEFLLNTNVLSVIRDWLKPLPDKTLPSMTIRETLLRCLLSFSYISKFALRDSGIGRIVMFFSKSDTEPIVKDLADKLIARWTHHASSENEYKNCHDAHRRLTPDQIRIYSQQLSFGRTLQGANDAKGQRGQRVHEQMYAAAPILSSMEYVIQPESTVDPKLVAQRSGLRISKNKFLKKF